MEKGPDPVGALFVSSYVLRRQWPGIAKYYSEECAAVALFVRRIRGGAPLEGINRDIEQPATPLYSRLTPARIPRLRPLTGHSVRGVSKKASWVRALCSSPRCLAMIRVISSRCS